MQQKNTHAKLAWWPSPQDYNEAIQNLHCNMQDEELQDGLVYSDAMGLPRPVTGAFASVYRIRCESGDMAVRCFLRNIADQAERYRHISHFVTHDDLPYTVSFGFLPEGLRVNNKWFPALKMDWVEGRTLDRYVIENLHSPFHLWEIQEKFKDMLDALRDVGIAHGDLQHGNIIVCDGELRLVDYDGMFVPAMYGFQSNELGHRNYQHPQRLAHHFGAYLDNFSAWIIYASLRALQLDPTLAKRLNACDDCMLFRHADFLRPQNSVAFAAFERHEDDELRMLGRFIRSLLDLDPANVPGLQFPVPSVEYLPSLAESVAQSITSVVEVGSGLPDWIHQAPAAGRVNAVGSLAGVPDWTLDLPEPVQWLAPTALPPPKKQMALTRDLLPEELQAPAPRKAVRKKGVGFDPRGAGQVVPLLLFMLIGVFLVLKGWMALMILFNPFFWLILVGYEFCIWMPAIGQKMLVEFGSVSPAEVTFKYKDWAVDGKHYVTVHFVTEYSQEDMVMTLEVTQAQWEVLVIGDVLPVLYDKDPPANVMIYQTCHYTAVAPPAPKPFSLPPP